MQFKPDGTIQPVIDDAFIRRRERFEAACAALRGLLSNPSAESWYKGNVGYAALHAVDVGDKLLAELERKKEAGE